MVASEGGRASEVHAPASEDPEESAGVLPILLMQRAIPVLEPPLDDFTDTTMRARTRGAGFCPYHFTSLLFPSGKSVNVGAHTPQQAQASYTAALYRALQDVVPGAQMMTMRPCNKVSSVIAEHPLDVEALRDWDGCYFSYEPSLFPGLSMPTHGATTAVFPTGTITNSGSTTYLAERNEATRHRLLRRYYLAGRDGHAGRYQKAQARRYHVGLDELVEFAEDLMPEASVDPSAGSVSGTGDVEDLTGQVHMEIVQPENQYITMMQGLG